MSFPQPRCSEPFSSPAGRRCGDDRCGLAPEGRRRQSADLHSHVRRPHGGLDIGQGIGSADCVWVCPFKPRACVARRECSLHRHRRLEPHRNARLLAYSGSKFRIPKKSAFVDLFINFFKYGSGSAEASIADCDVFQDCERQNRMPTFTASCAPGIGCRVHRRFPCSGCSGMAP
jgi:hypothetical protein